MGSALRYLLDTHTLLWWWTDDPLLSAHARDLIADEGHEIFVSAASAWEIATKHRLGKLPEAGEAVSRFNELVLADGFRHLPVSYLHALKAGAYSHPHRDPFDRMLAAQSEIEALPIVTCDSALAGLSTRTIW